MNELVSIVVPCFRAENHIVNLIYQVYRQTYDNYELLIIGNGEGQEKQASLVKSTLPTHPRTRYISIPIGSVSAARNTGIELAKGKWIVFVDADDEFTTEYVSSFISHSITAANADIINTTFPTHKTMRLTA